MAAEHPDLEWIKATVADLRSWLEQPIDEPTSQITGGGAVRVAEQRFSALHNDQPAVLVPSATYGMRAALLAVGVQPGDRVLIPDLDWGSTLAAVRSIAAEPVPVPTDPATQTIDPEAALSMVTPGVAAIVACHLHGVPADIPALAAAGVPVIEDCAQALGSTLDARPVGTLGSGASVFSFGPGKALDAGEAAIILCGNESTWRRVIDLTAHPVRQLLTGNPEPCFDGLSLRVCPVAAVRLAAKLAYWDPRRARSDHQRIAAALAENNDEAVILGGCSRRVNGAPTVPVLRDPDNPKFTVAPTGALDIRQLLRGRRVAAATLLAGLREATAVGSAPSQTRLLGVPHSSSDRHKCAFGSYPGEISSS